MRNFHLQQIAERKADHEVREGRNQWGTRLSCTRAALKTNCPCVCYRTSHSWAVSWILTLNGNKLIFFLCLVLAFQCFVVKGQKRWEFFKWKCFRRALCDLGAALPGTAATRCSSRLWLAGCGHHPPVRRLDVFELPFEMDLPFSG